MKKLLKFIKGYEKESVLGPLLKLFEASLELLVPYVVLGLINVGIAGGDRNYIISRGFILVGMGLAGLIFSVTAQYYSAKAACGFTARVREALFEKIQNLSYSELDKIGKSTFITRLTSDMNQVQSGLNLTLRLFLRSPFIVFGAMIMAFTIDAGAAMVFVVVIPVLSVVVFGIMIASIPLYKKVQQRLDAVLGKTRENLTGARVLRAFCKEDDEILDFDEKNQILTSAQRTVGKITAMLNPLTYVIINIAVAALIYSGALKVNSGILTQGAVIALYNYMSQILVELIKLANLIINITKSIACGKRIEAVLELETEMIEGIRYNKEQSEYAVEFRGVSMKYSVSSGNALEDISFTVKKGETIGIIGGTGSGKTTLINLIGRFYDAVSGEVLVDGKNVKGYSFDGLRGKIGIAPQTAALFSGTIRSNMLFGNENATDNEINEALETAQARNFVAQKEGGLDYIVEQGGKNLSGGQKQRLTVARAIVRKPEILILDDSSSALDFATDLAMRRAIKGLSYNPTVFIVSQRASSLAGTDKIIVLDDGKLRGCGTHETLMQSCDVYREIYASQNKAVS